MSTIIFDLQQLYQQQFGSKPIVAGYKNYYEKHIDNFHPNGSAGSVPNKPAKVLFTETGAPLQTTDLMGVEIWLPVEFYNLPAGIGDNGRLFLPYTVLRITGSSTIVRTPMAERIGSVKEQYNVEDYKITLKGFFIDKQNRLFPEKDLQALKKIHEKGEAFSIWNAITDIFLTKEKAAGDDYDQQQVVMTSFDLPEVEGGRKHVRPFIMTLESDNIFTLDVE